MGEQKEKKDYFETSHLIILLCYTLFSCILVGESILLKWELWALIVIAVGVAICWVIHIRQRLPRNTRMWIYAMLMMGTTFFYGTHVTSTYDLGLMMAVIILVFVSTGIPGTITLCQCTYYVAYLYDLYQMYHLGEDFDSLLISRSVLHLAIITIVSTIARGIIRKWNTIMEKSEEEKAELISSTEKLNDFLANISHEFRTPINAVIGLARASRAKEKDNEIKENLTFILEAGKRVSDQVSDILDYSEIDMDSLAVSNEDYMLASVLSDVTGEIEPYRLNNIELVIDVDPSIPNVMNSDVGKIKKIIHHLIDNGLKYTKEGGVYVHITSEEREYGINLCIEVTDTGIGMSSSEMERVYESFYQADSGRTRSSSGLGLGLAIVMGFTNKLNGFLMMESEQHKGTSVKLSIPQKVVDKQSCMRFEKPEGLKFGSYLHLDKYENPHVRDFYNSMVKDLVLGMGVKMSRADNMSGLKKLVEVTGFTHIFLGKEEYDEDREFIDRLAEEIVVLVVADMYFVPPKKSKIRVIRKPLYCFPFISFVNTYTGAKTGKEKLRAEGVRALIVDDETMNHTVTRGILTGYGMVVHSELSGWDAYNYIKENDADIIFMDHMMPGMDGVETMKKIREVLGKRGEDVPIIALTANAVSTAKEMFLNEGFDGFVSKPINEGELERVLRNVLPKSRITTKVEYIKTEDYNGDKKTDIGKKKNDGKKSVNSSKKKYNKNKSVSSVEKNNNTNKTSDSSKEKDDAYMNLEAYGIDIKEGLGYCQNDKELYEQLIMQFAEIEPERAETLSKFKNDADFKNYEISIHGLKSSSRMIGANKLADMAKDLEFAAKEKNVGTIDLNHGEAMSEYARLAALILENFGAKKRSEEKGGDVF